MTRDRRGFTLIEMLVVTVLGSLVLLAALQVLITNQRTYTAQSAAITGQQSTRVALEFLFNELRLVSPAGGDILQMSGDSMRVRMMRKFGRACSVAGITLATPVMLVTDYGPVDFVAGDSVFIFADKYQRDEGDDKWVKGRITAVTAGVCPQDASAAVQLTFAGQQSTFTADSVHVGAAVRSFTPVRFAPTTYSGDTYLGRGESGGALSPVAGPIRATGGLQFVYRDALGAVTATPANVRQIVVTVRSASGVLNSLNQPVTDSITAWIYTRN